MYQVLFAEKLAQECYKQLLEIQAKLALASFARGSVAWEGDHVRLLLLPKGLSKDVVGRISACGRLGVDVCLMKAKKHGSQQVCK